MDWRRWSDLPADVLREISSRVWASADFIYFHAVCKPWRNSRDPPSRPRTTTTQFLPWLLAPAEKESAHLKFRCVFSKASYCATPASSVPWRNWVCSADGTAFWYLTVENLRPSLRDPLTGEFTNLPLFPCHIGQWEKDNPRGIVYAHGSTFLYTIFRVVDGGVDTVRFKAALLNPRDAEWMVVERTFQAVRSGEMYAAYHGGKIMVTFEARLWHVITPDCQNVIAHDVLVEDPFAHPSWWYTCFSRYYPRSYSYLLESRGELLWALVEVETSERYNGQRWILQHKFSLTLHTLEEEEDSAPKKTMRWVSKEGKSLADRVLSLGWPNSFVVDASRLGGHDGGCAYLAYSGSKNLPRDQVGVFRLNLVSNKAEFIERLPREWNEGRYTWVIPQPTITPIQELTERRLIAREPNEELQEHMSPINIPTYITRIERYYEPSFRALVRNLPLTVTSSQLRLFLSKHGKVYGAEVLYYRQTKRSQGIGHLTMSTIHSHAEDAVEALSTLYLHGYKLDVCLVKGERRRLQIS